MPSKSVLTEARNIQDVTEALVEMFARVGFLDEFLTDRLQLLQQTDGRNPADV